MVKATASVVEHRAESLAVMYLTRRDDLVVSHQTADYGIDLLVTLCEAGKATGKLFGVQVKGATTARRTERHGEQISIGTSDDPARWLKSIPFPVCLLFFTMDDDQGYFKWLKEPVLLPDGSASLRIIQETHLRRLSNEAINGIVETVNRWYEAKATASSRR
ncbi:MAG: hypothetical protein JWL69_4619 [Phycisphaerales bacterium]|nr:hypothetical protein [Phycisphaerales bacterium]